ncbi:MAG: carbohydrate ABC transporter permease [Paracoccaceae bacterium]
MRTAGRAATYGILAIWSFVCLMPIYWLAITSIKGPADIDRPPGYLPFADFTPSLHAWRFIFFEHNENLSSRLVNSGLISAAATVLTVGCGGLAIYGLTRCRLTLRLSALAAVAVPLVLGLGWALVTGRPSLAVLAVSVAVGLGVAIGMRGRGPVLSAGGGVAGLLATRVLSPVVLALPLYVFGEALGARDTLGFLALVYTAINLPVAVWLMLPVLGPRASEQEEAAQIDGASHLAILFTIVLPMVRSGVIAVGLIVFLLAWNEYLFAAYLTSDHALTLPPWAVGQLSMKEAQVGGGPEEVAHLAAANIVMVLPALGFAAFALRSFGRTVRKG